jgi:hypothetical protein
MSNILKDLSTPALVKAIKANRFEWYDYLPRDEYHHTHTADARHCRRYH